MEEKLKAQFYTGNYKAIIETVSPEKESNPGVLILLLRSLIQMGQSLKSVQVPNVPTQNLKTLFSYLNGTSSAQAAKDSLEQDSLNATLSSIININEGDYSQVIDNLKPDSPEHLALLLCALLNFKRADSAAQLLESAMSQHEDEPLLEIVQTFVQIAKGDYEEAYSTLVELSQQFGESVSLMNAIGICALEDSNYPEAEHAFTRALELSRDFGIKQDIATSLKNLVACKRQKGEDPSSYEEELYSLDPNHEYFQTKNSASELFDKLIS